MGRAHSELQRRKAKNKFKKLKQALSLADDPAFLQMIWSVNILQSNSKTDVRKYFWYPPAAAKATIGSDYYALKWELENLVLLALSTPKEAMRLGRNRRLDCSNFQSLAHVTNLLKELENAESGYSIDKNNIMMEMHRIGHQQFPWQRGFASTERLYRFAFVYGQGKCNQFFEETFGYSVADFMEVCFALYAYTQTAPWLKPPNVDKLPIASSNVDKAISQIAKPLEEIRVLATEMVSTAIKAVPDRISYLPSVLREFPIIRSLKHNSLISPFPELIINRATTGLYYDIQKGPQTLVEEANRNFEMYAIEVLNAFSSKLAAIPSEKYGPKKARVDTPDVLITDEDEIVAVIECKATKLTFAAQYSDNPIDNAKNAYTQMVKAITQLWRFFSDARTGKYPNRRVQPDANAVVLTMDNWMQVSGELQREVTALARASISNNPDITEDDIRPVIFCSIQDLMDVLFVSTEEQLWETFKNASLTHYEGWTLGGIRDNIGPREDAKKFPFEVETLLPWWGKYSRN